MRCFTGPPSSPVTCIGSTLPISERKADAVRGSFARRSRYSAPPAESNAFRIMSFSCAVFLLGPRLPWFGLFSPFLKTVDGVAMFGFLLDCPMQCVEHKKSQLVRLALVAALPPNRKEKPRIRAPHFPHLLCFVN